MADIAYAIETGSADALDADLLRLVALTEELTAAIVEENELLSFGAPVPPGATARKAGIALRLEAISQQVHADPAALSRGSARRRAALETASGQLQDAMAENVVRLEAAMTARSARLDTIIGAIRDKTETETAYGANGRVQTAPRQIAMGRLA